MSPPVLCERRKWKNVTCSSSGGITHLKDDGRVDVRDDAEEKDAELRDAAREGVHVAEHVPATLQGFCEGVACQLGDRDLRFHAAEDEGGGARC